MNLRKKINKIRQRRARRSRAKIFGTSQRPRLSIFKSNKYIYLQLIDDQAQKTIASASTREPSLKEKGKKLEKAIALGEIIAQKAIQKGIKQAVLDRGRYKYHGFIKLIVDQARKSGLTI